MVNSWWILDENNLIYNQGNPVLYYSRLSSTFHAETFEWENFSHTALNSNKQLKVDSENKSSHISICTQFFQILSLLWLILNPFQLVIKNQPLSLCKAASLPSSVRHKRDVTFSFVEGREDQVIEVPHVALKPPLSPRGFIHEKLLPVLLIKWKKVAGS